MSQLVKFWHLLNECMRAEKAPMNLCISARCTELSLLAHTKKGCRLMQADFVRSQLIWIYNVLKKMINPVSA